MTSVQSNRTQDWQRFLHKLQAFAAEPVALEAQGTLVRVAGLVLEAAGIRVPVGSVCDIFQAGQPPVSAFFAAAAALGL